MAEQTETAAVEPESAEQNKDGEPSIGEVADALGLSAPEVATDENNDTKEETPEPSPEPEPEPTPEPEPKKDDRTQAKIDQRIGKEVAKRKELEEQVESERAANRDLARQLEEARQGNSQASGLSPDDPIASKTFEELKKMEEEQRNVKKWAVQNWDGYMSEEEGGQDFDAEEVRSLFNSSVENLEEKIPAAREKLAQNHRLQAAAVEKYPFLVDKNAPEFPHAAGIYNSKAYQAAAQADPAVALEMLGQAALARAQNMEKANTGPSSTPPAIPTDTAPAGPSSVSDSKPAEGLPIEEFVEAGASHDALVQLIQDKIS